MNDFRACLGDSVKEHCVLEPGVFFNACLAKGPGVPVGRLAWGKQAPARHRPVAQTQLTAKQADENPRGN